MSCRSFALGGFSFLTVIFPPEVSKLSVKRKKSPRRDILGSAAFDSGKSRDFHFGKFREVTKGKFIFLALLSDQASEPCNINAVSHLPPWGWDGGIVLLSYEKSYLTRTVVLIFSCMRIITHEATVRKPEFREANSRPRGGHEYGDSAGTRWSSRYFRIRAARRRSSACALLSGSNRWRRVRDQYTAADWGVLARQGGEASVRVRTHRQGRALRRRRGPP